MESLDTRRSVIESRIQAVADDIEPSQLSQSATHLLTAGGKRVRPTLTVLSCEAAGGCFEDALEFAVGIELVHTASLVVDDILDRSHIRRGVESTWVAYGHDGALIGSDALLAEAFSRFTDNPTAMKVVADAMIELGEGEATELVDSPATREEYLEFARRKTGVLFQAAATVGAIAAEADPATIAQLGTYAERVGVAFQIRDDVLDVTGDVDSLGKSAGRDQAMDRPSLLAVTAMSPDDATHYAQAIADEAVVALNEASIKDEEAKAYLEEFARFVVTRER